jgi:hypothetical protein
MERGRALFRAPLLLTPARAVLSGGLAQDMTIIVVYPIRSGKDKLQGQKQGEYSGLLDVWRAAYRKAGIRGDYLN